jgi:inorganic pyrophosphatase
MTATADHLLEALPAWDRSTRLLHVVVAPKGSRIKFKFDVEKRCNTIAHVLPAGAAFPFDFGAIPRTLAEDGDPMDVLVLIEEQTFTGCLVPVRLLGALEAEQTVEGKTGRNDRLIGAAAASRRYSEWKALSDVPDRLLGELERFFVSYNEERGRVFRVLRRSGRRRAETLVEEGERRFREKKKRGS